MILDEIRVTHEVTPSQAQKFPQIEHIQHFVEALPHQSQVRSTCTHPESSIKLHSHRRCCSLELCPATEQIAQVPLDVVKDGEGRGPGRTSRVEGFIGTEEETKRGKAGRGLYSDGETTRRKK
jgi:hypothetical protein